MMGMRKFGDTVGAVLKSIRRKDRAQKSFGWSFNKNIASKVDETWEAVKKDIFRREPVGIDNLKSLGREKRILKRLANKSR